MSERGGHGPKEGKDFKGFKKAADSVVKLFTATNEEWAEMEKHPSLNMIISHLENDDVPETEKMEPYKENKKLHKALEHRINFAGQHGEKETIKKILSLGWLDKKRLTDELTNGLSYAVEHLRIEGFEDCIEFLERSDQEKAARIGITNVFNYVFHGREEFDKTFNRLCDLGLIQADERNVILKKAILNAINVGINGENYAAEQLTSNDPERVVVDPDLKKEMLADKTYKKRLQKAILSQITRGLVEKPVVRLAEFAQLTKKQIQEASKAGIKKEIDSWHKEKPEIDLGNHEVSKEKAVAMDISMAIKQGIFTLDEASAIVWQYNYRLIKNPYRDFPTYVLEPIKVGKA